MDNSPRHTTAGTVVAKDPGKTWIRVQLLDGVPMDEGVGCYAANAWLPTDPPVLKNVRSLTYGTSPANWTIYDEPNRIMELKSSSQLNFVDLIDVGEIMTWHYGAAGNNMMYNGYSDGMALRNIRVPNVINAFANLIYSRDVTLQDISLRSDNNCPAVGPRDGFHISSVGGTLLIENVDIEGVRQDPIVLRTRYGHIDQITNSTHFHINALMGGVDMPAGSLLGLWSADGELEYIEVISATWNSTPSSGYDIVTASPLPAWAGVGTELKMSAFMPESALITGCNFKNNAAVDIILFVDNVTMRNNTHFKSMDAAIHLGSNSSAAGVCGNNIKILDSIFTDCGWFGKNSTVGAISMNNVNEYQTAKITNLEIRGNIFSTQIGREAIALRDLDGGEISHNTFVNVSEAISTHQPTVSNVSISNNRVMLEYPDIVLEHTDGDTTVTEGGDSDTYTVVLNQAPDEDVTVSLTVDDQVTVTPTSLTFTTSNWSVPQVVTVTAVDDDLHELIHTGTITHTSSSLDPMWDGVIQDFVVTVIDNDNTAPEVDAGENLTVALSGSEPWTPDFLPLAAWYDAADESTITKDGSDRVSQWRDQSGNEHHVNQSSNGAKPLSGTRTLNGLNALAFSGSANQFLRSTEPISGQPLTAFAVARFNSAGNNSTVFDGAGSRCMLRRRSNEVLAIYAGSWFDGAATTAEAVLASVEFNGANSMIRKNGGTPVIGNPGTQGLTSGLTIGNISGNPGENWRMDGLISELIFLSGSLPDAERQRLEGYLGHKWGLQENLPADYPYKSAAPSTAIATAPLSGNATDADGDPLVTTWSVVSGPGGVTFADSNAVDTVATFREPGTYVLRLTADDSLDTTFDEVTITVTDAVEETFSDWISGFDLGERSGFNDDYNQDGVSNGTKYFFGIDPREPSPALSVIAPEAASPSQFSFTHPMADGLPGNVHGEYRWTKDLATFSGDGATDEDGTTVTFVRSEPVDGTVTVTATINGTPTDRIFVTLFVTLDE